MNKQKESFKPHYWHEIQDGMAYHETYPSISLLMDMGYGLTCNVSRNGIMEITTESGGGHGEGRYRDKGRSFEDWIMLLHEAAKAADYY